jgi:hypothetical protein
LKNRPQRSNYNLQIWVCKEFGMSLEGRLSWGWGHFIFALKLDLDTGLLIGEHLGVGGSKDFQQHDLQGKWNDNFSMTVENRRPKIMQICVKPFMSFPFGHSSEKYRYFWITQFLVLSVQIRSWFECWANLSITQVSINKRLVKVCFRKVFYAVSVYIS